MVNEGGDGPTRMSRVSSYSLNSHTDVSSHPVYVA